MSKKKATIANTLKTKKKTFFSWITKVRRGTHSPKHSVFTRLFQKPAFFSSGAGALLMRMAVIAFFLGLNISLGKAFLDQNKVGIPYPVATLLLQYGIIPGKEVTLEKLTNPYATEVKLEAADIVTALNKVRRENNLEAFTADEKLASAAAVLLADLEAHEFKLDRDYTTPPLEKVVQDSGYTYAWVHHNSLVGPLSAEAAITAWLSDADQEEALLTPEFTDVGLAVAVVDTSFMGKAGIIVQLLAEPQTTAAKNQAAATVKSTQPTLLEEFSDASVVDALNGYRATHGISPLKVHDDLCVYAQKRVGDLVAHGSLDNHAGFIADFEQEDPPPGILAYGGGTIGENLASQYCINGTSGETIYAQTPTQLIEWCFDSSQKGHREAQLSKEYTDICVRHDENMYVVIFGGH